MYGFKHDWCEPTESLKLLGNPDYTLTYRNSVDSMEDHIQSELEMPEAMGFLKGGSEMDGMKMELALIIKAIASEFEMKNKKLASKLDQFLISEGAVSGLRDKITDILMTYSFLKNVRYSQIDSSLGAKLDLFVKETRRIFNEVKIAIIREARLSGPLGPI